MQPFTLHFARPAVELDSCSEYAYDRGLQLNVLPDGRIAATDHATLRALGTTTSTAGSKTHFDD
ncbi:putative ATP-grasp-modified RiPP [Streptomyces sp. J2-1]|uniref:putative ATP-grasp-modified RiPP n=1 Tax=Streptomyces corallincola TaxID=2851888 RepID=UPI001C3897EA|nr:putative ATP-grasp-modified RiPP [Streptomyces corallincola]MBV2356240.1 putative ATP-grasp-modified RiPP [Streptomyces corallincola]